MNPSPHYSTVTSIVSKLGPRSIADPPKRLPVENVLGILKTGRPAPTDSECERILEEERLKRCR